MSVEQSKSSTEEPFLKRAISASPLGALALVGGLVLAIVFLVRFEQITGDVANADLRSAIQALEITVVSVWIAVAMWGWYLIRDGLERVAIRRHVEEQALVLSRIREAVEERDVEKAKKEDLERKSRSFWDWRRNDPR